MHTRWHLLRWFSFLNNLRGCNPSAGTDEEDQSWACWTFKFLEDCSVESQSWQEMSSSPLSDPGLTWNFGFTSVQVDRPQLPVAYSHMSLFKVNSLISVKQISGLRKICSWKIICFRVITLGPEVLTTGQKNGPQRRPCPNPQSLWIC